MAINRNLGDKDHYNPLSLYKYHNEKELREEYRRYRDITRKRLDRLEKNNLLPQNTIDNWRNEISDKPKDLDKHELSMKLSHLDSFLDSASSTVTGARAKQKQFIETMRDKGYTFITSKNVNDFINFMNETKAYAQAHVIGSDVIVDLLQAVTNAGIKIDEVKRNFNFYLANRDKLQSALYRKKSKNPLSTKELKEMLNKGKKNTSKKKLQRRKKQNRKKK